MKSEKELFRKIWAERPHVSQVSGKPLGNEARAHYFAHIIPKGGYPGYRLREDNICLMTMEEHSLYDHATHKAKDMPEFDWVFQKAEELRQQYNKRFSIGEGYHFDDLTEMMYNEHGRTIKPRIRKGKKQYKVTVDGKARWVYPDQFGMTKGWYEHNSFEDYLANDGYLQSSHIKTFAKSPKHFQYSLSQDSKSSKAQEMGTAAHSAILTPGLFEKEYGWHEGKPDGRIKKSKPEEGRYCHDDWEDIRISQGVDFLLPQDDYLAIMEMQKNALLNPSFRSLVPMLEFIEVSFYAKLNSIKLKARSDAITHPVQKLFNRDIGGRVWIDVKTTKDASPKGFIREMSNYDYALSMVHHCTVVETVLGEPIKSRYILAVENTPPYDAQLYCVDGWYESALDEYTHWLSYMMECEKSGKYPGFIAFSDEASGIIELPCPSYIQDRVLNTIDYDKIKLESNKP